MAPRSLLTMITSPFVRLFRKVLLTFGYPRLDGPPFLVGPHQTVGAIQVRIPNGTACQVFYPAVSSNQQQQPQSSSAPYFRPAAVQGLIEYLRFGDGLFQLLSETKHPCQWQADPITTIAATDANEKDKNTPTKNVAALSSFPLVIFSHGLAGTMEMYTELCQHVASLGYCVVALEHQDGSAAYAETATGTFIPYQRPNDEPYSRQKVWKLRTPMLHRRVQELERVVEYIVEEKKRQESQENTSNSAVSCSNDIFSKVIQVTDPNQIHLIGHSFGAATQLLAAQQWTSKTESSSSPSSSAAAQYPIKSLLVLDAWAFALQENVIRRGLSDSSSIPLLLLSIISEDWVTNPECDPLVQFLQNSLSSKTTNVLSYYAKDSVHQSFSDSEAWFPSWVATRVKNRGTNEKRHVTIRTVVQFWKDRLDDTTNDDDDDNLASKKKKKKNNDDQHYKDILQPIFL